MSFFKFILLLTFMFSMPAVNLNDFGADGYVEFSDAEKSSHSLIVLEQSKTLIKKRQTVKVWAILIDLAEPVVKTSRNYLTLNLPVFHFISVTPESIQARAPPALHC